MGKLLTLIYHYIIILLYYCIIILLYYYIIILLYYYIITLSHYYIIILLYYCIFIVILYYIFNELSRQKRYIRLGQGITAEMTRYCNTICQKYWRPLEARNFFKSVSSIFPNFWLQARNFRLHGNMSRDSHRARNPKL